MKNIDQTKEYIKNMFEENWNETKNISLQKVPNETLKGKCWATAVVFDICNFKNIVKKHENEIVLKLIRIYHTTIINLANDSKYKSNIVDINTTMDKIIIVFQSVSKEDLANTIDFVIHANSFLNYLITNKIKKISSNNIQLKFGIGVWSSNDNSLIVSEVANKVYSTTIGSAVEHASFLAKIANRTKGIVSNKEIMLNEVAKINLSGDVKDIVNINMSRTNSVYGENIWHGNLCLTEYK